MLKLKKTLNKEVLTEFIEKDKDKEIEYTDNDVKFYNEYLGSKGIEDITGLNMIIKGSLIFFGCLMIVGSIFNINLFLELILLSSLGVMFTIVDIGFKNCEIFGLLHKLKKLDFNNHYFLEQKISKRLEGENIKIDTNVLNKIIKKYPEKQNIKDFLNSNNKVYKDQNKIYYDYKVVIKYLDK